MSVDIDRPMHEESRNGQRGSQSDVDWFYSTGCQAGSHFGPIVDRIEGNRQTITNNFATSTANPSVIGKGYVINARARLKAAIADIATGITT